MLALAAGREFNPNQAPYNFYEADTLLFLQEDNNVLNTILIYNDF